MIQEKAQAYIASGQLTEEEAANTLRTIEQERGVMTEANAHAQATRMTDDQTGADGASDSNGVGRVSRSDLEAILKDREDKMKTGAGISGETDQWVVYTKIRDAIASNRRLRLMVQASAGTGDSRTAMYKCYRKLKEELPNVFHEFEHFL